MVSQLELVKKFCSTYDIKYFFMLNKETQKFFKEAAYYLLGLHDEIDYDKPLYEGIATIISNATTPTIYKPFGKLYSLTEVEVIESTKYGMKLLLLGDSHTYNHGCPKKSDDVVTFIEKQVDIATCFIDLYLEVPYIWEKKGAPIELADTWMAKLHERFWDCFTWSKHCHHANLRAHYVDLRNVPNDKYLAVEKIIVGIYYKIPISVYRDSINSILNDNQTKKIFQNSNSVIKHINSVIDKTKINKQIQNVKDPKVKKVIEKYKKIWEAPGRLTNPGLISWANIEKTLKGKATRRLIEDLYFTLATLPATLMDLYTIARMFRDFKDTPDKYSLPAKNIIVFAGAFHTQRYRDLLVKELGFKITFQQFAKTRQWTPGRGHKKAGNLCVDVSKLDQPVFRSEKALSQKPSTKYGKKTKMVAPDEDMTEEEINLMNADFQDDFDPENLPNADFQDDFDLNIFDNPPPENNPFIEEIPPPTPVIDSGYENPADGD
jgi:hypothetical protein